MRLSLATGACGLCLLCGSPAPADTVVAPQDDLSDLSIEQLANIQVRSASKRDEPLSAAPAALYVIDHEQIVRSGAVTTPEMLRLAPNLQVYQQSTAHWVVTARGAQRLAQRAEFFEQAAGAGRRSNRLHPAVFRRVLRPARPDSRRH
jgi:iron complex outermembrane recepter protein